MASGSQTIFILLGVTELQQIFWLKFAAQFYQRSFIEQAMQAITRRHTHVMITLRTNLKIAL